MGLPSANGYRKIADVEGFGPNGRAGIVNPEQVASSRSSLFFEFDSYKKRCVLGLGRDVIAGRIFGCKCRTTAPWAPLVAQESLEGGTFDTRRKNSRERQYRPSKE